MGKELRPMAALIMHKFYFILLAALVFVSCSKEEAITIGIQPFDNFDPALTDTVLQALTRTYKARVYILDHRSLPGEAFVNVKSPRYRADKIVGLMRKQKPDSLDYLISLTDQDISTTKRDELGRVKEPEEKYNDWGVFGLGYVDGPTCIVSTYRLKKARQQKFIERLKKVAIHELGHNLGLVHCESDRCVMKDAVETIKTIDSEDSELCPQCRKRITI